jgi:2-polyprenyl-3-methyl-5-hydroxy-6-metoxy-1,4-benzoquinol methylase
LRTGGVTVTPLSNGSRQQLPRRVLDDSPDGVEALLEKYIRTSANPELIAYGEQAALTEPQRFIALVMRLMQLSAAHECRVLDVGCGYGWVSMLLSVLGRNAVTAVDVRPEFTAAVQERVQSMRGGGVPLRVEVVTGDITTVDLPEASFDVVFSMEAIEHVRDLDAMFARCRQLLVPGGRLIVTDSNNALNCAVRRLNFEMWPKRDRSVAYCEKLKAESPLSNIGIEPYAVMRERIVHSANPELDDASVRRVAAASAGLIAHEIEGIAQSYTDGGALPVPPRLSWCRDPITGEYCERLLDPFAVRDTMARNGLPARVLPVFRRTLLRPLNVFRWRPVLSLLFGVKSQFAVLARRPS